MILCLTGMMGCGKSSAGRLLAERLGVPFLDLDNLIETRTGRSIPEIFATDGEAAFRVRERETLGEILDRSGSCVLALGGGTVMTPACADLVRNRTCCVYLRTGGETLFLRLTSGRQETAGRPLLGSAQDTEALRRRIVRLLDERDPVYAAVARHTVDTDGLPLPEVADRILAAVRGR